MRAVVFRLSDDTRTADRFASVAEPLWPTALVAPLRFIFITSVLNPRRKSRNNPPAVDQVDVATQQNGSAAGLLDNLDAPFLTHS